MRAPFQIAYDVREERLRPADIDAAAPRLQSGRFKAEGHQMEGEGVYPGVDLDRPRALETAEDESLARRGNRAR
jgi:hypothetical protein